MIYYNLLNEWGRDRVKYSTLISIMNKVFSQLSYFSLLNRFYKFTYGPCGVRDHLQLMVIESL